jgi:hypothetical protein
MAYRKLQELGTARLTAIFAKMASIGANVSHHSMSSMMVLEIFWWYVYMLMI